MQIIKKQNIVFTSLILAVFFTLCTRGRAVELYASTNGSGNFSGSDASNAIKADTYTHFDDIFNTRRATAEVIVHLADGIYETDGVDLNVYSYSGLVRKIYGHGENTIIKLRNLATIDARRIQVIFYNSGWYPLLDNFTIKDCTLDCNFNGQGSEGTSDLGFESEGVDITCKIGIMDGVGVHDFGSTSVTNYSQPWETFPIRVRTSHPSGDDSHSITISWCSVWNFHATNCGYCTCIMVATRIAIPGETPADLGTGYSSSWAASVNHCDVSDVTLGVGMGCGSADKVAFYSNVITNCQVGFQCDSSYGNNARLTINSNSFVVCRGANCFAAGNNLIFDHNNLGLTGPQSSACWGAIPSFILYVYSDTTADSIHNNTYYEVGSWAPAQSYKRISTPGSNSLTAGNIQSDFTSYDTPYTTF
jgi:hypothetical protein